MLTMILAIWGAVISTVALLWNILRAYKDKGKIKVSAEFTVISKKDLLKENPELANILLQDANSEDALVERFRITLFNIGKRPITVTRLRITNSRKRKHKMGDIELSSDGGAIEFFKEFPVVLKEGEFWSSHYSTHIIDKFFTGIEAVDSQGQIHFFPKDAVIKIKKQSEFRSLSEDEKQKQIVDGFKRKRINV
jgi:hypothetical protein